MKFKLGASRPMIKQLGTMSGIIQYLKVTSQDIPKEEQALNVICALPTTDLWRNLLLVMVYNDNIMSFKAMSKHLKMEDERKKSLTPPNVAFFTKGSELRVKGLFVTNKPRTVLTPP